jgi:hypothetical protein
LAFSNPHIPLNYIAVEFSLIDISAIINKTLCKVKPPAPLQGQALRVLQKIFSLILIWLLNV